MKVTGIFRSYDDIDAAVLRMADLGVFSRNVTVSGFSDTDFSTEFASEYAACDLDSYANGRKGTNMYDYNPMKNRVFAAGASLIVATQPSSSKLFSGEPNGANVEAISLNALSGDERTKHKHYNKYVAAVACRTPQKADMIAERLRNCGAENVVVTNS